MSQPKTLFLHTNTNHFDDPYFNMERMEEECVFKIKEMCRDVKLLVPCFYAGNNYH